MFQAEQKRLTRREREVVCYGAVGCTDEETASILSISRQTVKNHWCNIRKKLGARNKHHAVAIMMRSIIEEEQAAKSSGVYRRIRD